jgi:hypothetical protein
MQKRMLVVLSSVVLIMTACDETGDGTHGSAGPNTSDTTTTSATASGASTSPTPAGPVALPDGPVTPGRYRFAVPDTCDPTMNEYAVRSGCPTDKLPALPALDITVPEGWDAAPEVLSLFPTAGRDTTSPNSPALALGWTSHWVGLNSQPCSRVSHHKPDIAVGPTVDDFVDAVVAHPLLDITEPEPVKLGRYRGQFFSLLGPKDISDCEEWRPWDPAPYLQGPENRWDLWVMNVDGVRVVIMAEYFPETPDDIKTELRAMAESVRFKP